MMGLPEVIYKTKLPEDKLPYYRLTTFMDEHFGDPDLMGWFEWITSKGIPCVVAMGTAPGNWGKLAVWVWGEEAAETPEMRNVETIGRIVVESQLGWPVDQVPKVVIEQLELF
jgi:hypothetical protein